MPDEPNPWDAVSTTHGSYGLPTKTTTHAAAAACTIMQPRKIPYNQTLGLHRQSKAWPATQGQHNQCPTHCCCMRAYAAPDLEMILSLQPPMQTLCQHLLPTTGNSNPVVLQIATCLPFQSCQDDVWRNARGNASKSMQMWQATCT
jgi:hypothetical protein